MTRCAVSPWAAVGGEAGGFWTARSSAESRIIVGTKLPNPRGARHFPHHAAAYRETRHCGRARRVGAPRRRRPPADRRRQEEDEGSGEGTAFAGTETRRPGQQPADSRDADGADPG